MIDDTTGPPTRLHHHFFAHRLLPQLVSLDPDGFLASFQGGKGDALLAELWERAASASGTKERVEPEGLSFTLAEASGGRTVVVVQLPEPKGFQEAYYVGAGIRPGARKLLGRSKPSARIFMLERSLDDDGEDTTLLAEWVHTGRVTKLRKLS